MKCVENIARNRLTHFVYPECCFESTQILSAVLLMTVFGIIEWPTKNPITVKIAPDIIKDIPRHLCFLFSSIIPNIFSLKSFFKLVKLSPNYALFSLNYALSRHQFLSCDLKAVFTSTCAV